MILPFGVILSFDLLLLFLFGLNGKTNNIFYHFLIGSEEGALSYGAIGNRARLLCLFAVCAH